MLTIHDLTDFFAWASLLNIGLLILTTFGVVVMRKIVTPIHSRLLGISQKDLLALYFQYLTTYKALTLAFFVVPYIALSIMSR